MNHILVIKIGALGDVARSTVMLSALHERFPQARVTWVSSTEGAELLGLLRNPPHTIPVNAHALLKGSLAQRARAVLDINRRLAGRVYDLAIVPYRNGLYHLLRLGARAKKVRSFGHARGLIPGRSQCIDYVRLIGGNDRDTLHWPTFPPLDAAKLPPLAVSSQILLAPGGGNLLMRGAVRRWPAEHYVELARALRAQGLSVGIMGSNRDEVDTAAFAGLGVNDYVGGTSIAHMLALLHKARVLVSNDSGPLHCMNLLGRGLVGLFGPTNAAEMLAGGPGAHKIALQSTLPCCPCYDGKNFAACTEAQCMRHIPVHRVLDAVSTLLTDEAGTAAPCSTPNMHEDRTEACDA